jgi:hypothetical protein
MQFMEDAFATSASFRSGGKWIFRSDPNGAEVTILRFIPLARDRVY